MTPQELEAQIELAMQSMLHAESDSCRRYHCARMSEFIAQRTPETVERMELERGLR